MGKNKYKKKAGGSAGFSSTPTSKYRAPTAGYEDEIFEFGNQGAAKFDRTLRRLARYLATTSIKGITAYTPLLEAMKDPE